jgi:hypothetical protein
MREGWHPRELAAVEDDAISARVAAEHPLAGVTAGSALLAIGERLLAVHDDAFRLSWIDPRTLEVTPLAIAGDGSALPKSSKPDFEAAVYAEHSHAVYLLGSGSTNARCKIVRVDLDSGAVVMKERPDLYAFVQDALGLATRPNIEGAMLDRGRLALLHRGVGGAVSARVGLRADALDGPSLALLSSPDTLALGALDAVPLGITDGAGTFDRTIFVAAAEATCDAFADGAVTGSVIGEIDDRRARYTRVRFGDGSPFRGKLEGLVVDDELTSAWALTDADDPLVPTTLCRLDLAGFRSSS